MIEGITVNGVDMITWGADGRITEFKVMVRPLKAINLIHKIMRLEFQKQSALKLVSRIIPEAIVTLAESKWNAARSARGTIPPT